MIYLDHAATTLCAPEVVEGMLPYFRDTFANASSIDHAPGVAARRAVDEARECVAAMVGAKPEDVIFTSGATEANNLVLSVGRRVLTSPVEHPSVLDSLSARKRVDDAFVAVDSSGRVELEALREALMSDANALVSIIATNNEIGTEQDVEAIAEVVYSFGALLHLDATQAVGTRAFDLRGTKSLSGLSLSAHKLYGPKGVGALVATAALRRTMMPILRGGGHERGLRSGTLNVPGIVGFGIAAQLAVRRRAERRNHLLDLRRRFLDVLMSKLGDHIHETVREGPVSPHILSIRLSGINGRALLRAVRNEVAFSLGSACATNKAEPSHVLIALGLEKRAIAETIRISFSAEQSTRDIESAALILVGAASSLSAYSLAT